MIQQMGVEMGKKTSDLKVYSIFYFTNSATVYYKILKCYYARGSPTAVTCSVLLNCYVEFKRSIETNKLSSSEFGNNNNTKTYRLIFCTYLCACIQFVHVYLRKVYLTEIYIVIFNTV